MTNLEGSIAKELDTLHDSLYKYKATVVKIVDGDTMDFCVDLGFGITITQRFRVNNFDAPETWRPRNEAERQHGEQAKARATELLVGDIYIESSKIPGVYGRYSATLWLEDGRNFASVMISEGLEKRETYVVEDTTTEN
jgi:Kyanoviridae endonuclease